MFTALAASQMDTTVESRLDGPVYPFFIGEELWSSLLISDRVERPFRGLFLEGEW